MKQLGLFSAIITAIIFQIKVGSAQLPVKIVSGLIYMDDGTLTPNQKKYPELTDSLDKKLKINDKDTSSLFYRALLYLRYNSILAKPYQREKSALDNLLIAKNMVEKADSLKMNSLYLKVLRAEIYREICYRFTGDEFWQFNNKRIAIRKAQFNGYKELSNKYYDELAVIDKRDTYDFNRLKVTYKYPL